MIIGPPTRTLHKTDDTESGVSRPWTGWYQAVADGLNTTVTAASVPKHAASQGTKGSVAHDGDYLYVCVDTNIWKRTPKLESW
ncbi:MAG: hypothetical protein ABSA33_05485 [Candidatus Micrarchaeaceae archaeon]